LQLLRWSEPFDLRPESGNLLRFGSVEFAALLLYPPKLLKITEKIVVDNFADLFVLCGVVGELLAVLLDHLLQLRQFRACLRLAPSVALVVY
jgi:hypothetical protein